MEGYESKEIWTHDQDTFFTMASRLQKSPLFPAEVPVPQLQSMTLSLQRAFQLEEIRVASTKPQEIYPMLLPRILTTALAIEPKLGVRIDDLASLLAARFNESYPMEDLKAAFKKVPEIWQSKSDRIVITEMFHAKAFEQKWQLGYLDGASQIFVFHVSLKIGR
ncbi:hypothetical protein N7451_012832 [Penicillium sp. IBT 35674x]|nr:hypothetical protein N7451_012832 [Penicillium sp. IBT 35674x]